ncbi:MAG: GTP-binding protein TypA [Candidatus Liptonbacteria bacterium RIFCSPHIGHO2_01_FULL_57_28]|uniref:Large ribosomal subunit assembly factor BipA n=1 Tax=Candidatus Liptonbacteria bacterium RIFCSPHIGHO2_01_FULL_57_28 TaxID=1798647 RepID=A0A1G2CB25_9BACT|nr:MAG: GTP-binding protein TypA [Candidatus Liptonbacteria bacterium RIFCSPHIGHO2_01_FULL_57_28]
MAQDIRNIAIIAHVDHGKTTLVDALLKQSADFKQKSGDTKELIMDSNDLERERGITIFSKNAAVHFEGVKINIVDTPGHADFGGEVERIMRMVDGALLLIDAKEGPMPQTKFVLKKAIQADLKIIVVINKIDKPGARPNWAADRTFDLFVDLGASDEQAEFPIIYASAIQGKAGHEKDLETMKDVRPLFETIVKTIPPPKIDATQPLQMLTVNLAYDNYKGKIAIGRLYSGVLKKGIVAHVNRAGEIKKVPLTAIMTFDGLGRVDVDSAEAGDIVAVSGIPNISIGETITDPDQPIPLPPIDIEKPTVKMNFSVNNSPFAGREGEYVTSRNLAERLAHEIETDVALRVEATDTFDTWTVSGRGELHLAILVEKMRREGYEFQVGRPQVIFHEKGGKKLEPVERVNIEVPEQFTGTVIEEMGRRKGTMIDMRVEAGAGTAFLEFLVPTRGLIGFRNQFLTATKGQGIMNTLFEDYEEYKGDLEASPRGSLVASESGISRAYGMMNIEDRGTLFISPGLEVYAGMIVGQNAKAQDLRVNVCKEKQLSNMRAKSDGGMEFLKVPRTLSLEESIEYLGDDELAEITPKSIRLRKFWLNENDEKRMKKGLA